MQARNRDQVRVLDVSHHQGVIDWRKVADASIDGQPIRGVFIKATEGTTLVDRMLQANAANAVAAGLAAGFYHYAHPERNDPTIEARHFAGKVKSLGAVLPHVLDVEGSAAKLGRAELTGWCLKWLAEVERLSGHPVMLYSGASFARTYFDNRLAGYPLWIAHYGVEQPLSNPVWERWTVFQYSDKGRVPGISGYVDLNMMERGCFEKLIAQKVKPSAPSPPKEQQVSEELPATIVVRGGIELDGWLKEGRVVGRISELLDALEIKYTWDNDSKKLYIHG